MGFYVVNYPLEEWNKWAELLQDAERLSQVKLTEQDISNLLYDASMLANVNLLPYSNALSLMSALKTKPQLSSWTTGSTIISNLWPYFATSDTSGLNLAMSNQFSLFAQSLVENVYRNCSLQTPDVEDDLVRQRLCSTVAAFACAYGLDECLLEAQVEFKLWKNDPSNHPLSSNTRTTVLRYAIQQSSEDDWHYLWNVYANEINTNLKLSYLSGLAQTSNVNLLNL